MNLCTLIVRGLRQHVRTHTGVVGGVAVAAATLVGALVVGDSVRFSLARHASLRIGKSDVALSAHDRFFADDLAGRIEARLAGARAAGFLQVAGTASLPDGEGRVHDVQVLGVEPGFFELAPGGVAPELPAINPRLATELGWSAGDELVLRIEKPSAVPGDMVLAIEEDSVTPLRVAPSGIAGDGEFARFSLSASQVPPATIFVERGELQGALELGARTNSILAELPDGVDPAACDEALAAVWSLADAELEIRGIEDGLELVSHRIFLEEPVVAAAESLRRPLLGVATYFVNELRLGDRATPYSMVTALVPLPSASRGDGAAELGAYSVVPRDLGEEGIVLNAWTREDLDASEGDEVTLAYFAVGPGRELVERTRSFRVRGTVPLAGLAADRSLMPPFPGLHDAENCREWEPGIPVDLDRIRDKDEEYWDEHQGTPKAFVSASAAESMWSSRFGWLSAIRTTGSDRDALAAEVREALDPREVGLFFRDVRSSARSSGSSATDFGGLFIGLSLFLIVAALLLTGLLFVFGLESRAGEIGLFLALGFEPRRVRRIYLGEATMLAGLGALLGSALGLLYTRAVLYGLDTLWRGAVGRASLVFHVEPLTVALGAVSALFTSTAAMLLTLRWLSRSSAVRLLHARPGDGSLGQGADPGGSGAPGRPSRMAAALLLVGAIALVSSVDPSAGLAAAGAYFGAGSMVLAAGLVGIRLLLRGRASGLEDPRGLGRLGLRNARRRAGRSLAVCALVAVGAFLVCAIGVYRQGPTPDDAGRASGTGGFAFFARASVPVLADLTSLEGREAFGLQEEELGGVSFLPMRVRDGDEASCLNLARPQEPRLLGLDPEAMISRGAFSFAKATDHEGSPWSLLEEDLGEGVVPVIGDVTSLTWTLKLGLGDELTYTGERGQSYRVRIVAALADSILQGDLLMAEGRFEELYPSESGYRTFLIDAPPGGREEVQAELSRGLSDVGLALEPAGRRLDAFHAVQNTYLAIFQLLGGLGVLLGSVGLGMVVLRNAFERRGELALAGAVGFSGGAVRYLLWSEHGALLLGGLSCGLLASSMAILPALGGAGPELSVEGLAWLLVGVAGNGMVWILLATRAAVRSADFACLREE